MKRCWIGAGLLALFGVLGLICALSLGRFGQELEAEVLNAAQLWETDKAEADKLVQRAVRRWEKKRFWLTTLSDHKPIREADTLFALLQNPTDADSFRENALRLALVLRDLGQSQLPRWENVL